MTVIYFSFNLDFQLNIFRKFGHWQELTYDYGYVLDSVSGPDGKVKQLPCYCGAADCRKRLY